MFDDLINRHSIPKIFGGRELDNLSRIASKDNRRRKNFNLHADFNDPVQYFINRVYSDSYIRPHQHDIESGEEIIVSLGGTSATVIFSDAGIIEEIILLSPFHLCADKKSAVVVTLFPGTWHTVIALDENVTLLEVKKGPFNPDAAKIFADWAPAEGSKLAPAYLNDLISKTKTSFF
jgi:cupin fold WbuC family metalloprotein